VQRFTNLEIAMRVNMRVPLEELEKRERQETDAKLAKRLRIVILAIRGYTAPAVAMSLGLSRRIVQRWVRRYNDEGIPGLEDQRGNQRGGPLTPEQEVYVRQRLEAGPTSEDKVCSLRGADMQCLIQQEFGIWRCLSAIYGLLHRMGYSYLRPRPKHSKADAEAQAAFLAQLPQRLAEIQAAHPDKRLRIFFQDESRFGQQGTTTNVCARRGSRPSAVRQTEYEYLWVLGMVCPETGQAEGLLSPRLNTDVINVFLREFSATLSAEEHAVMLWDGAGFHTSKRLSVPENVTPLKLPAYSPELNPIENLWHYLKSHYWSNRAYDNYEALEVAAVEAWRHAVLDSELMKTVCAAPFLERANSR
jgi:transposase